MLNTYAAVLEAAFPARRMGVWRAALNTGQVSFINDATQQFTGVVAPLGSADASVNVPADAVLASVETAWGPVSSANDLALTLYNSASTKVGDVNAPNRPGLTG